MVVHLKIKGRGFKGDERGGEERGGEERGGEERGGDKASAGICSLCEDNTFRSWHFCGMKMKFRALDARMTSPNG
jgi:hypothetical protein